ncbi:MAG: type II toxin-antitoxin system prevent-host-death family antitoxin [Actinobacteria bacterium]|nr:type II toxin-antitoxin system prevent-host-death family antitoxin [Actinomycetota bacterium]
METVGVKTLKNNLSKYLKQVKDGDSIIITQNNRPIAKLIPIQYPHQKELLTMIEEGIASWGGGKPRGATAPVHLKGTKTTADRVIEDRR